MFHDYQPTNLFEICILHRHTRTYCTFSCDDWSVLSKENFYYTKNHFSGTLSYEKSFHLLAKKAKISPKSQISQHVKPGRHLEIYPRGITYTAASKSKTAGRQTIR